MEDLIRAEQETEINPTEAQKKSGNYKKGKFKFAGMLITIENPKGSFRKGVDTDGNPWETEMKFTYGYINRTIGKDGDHIDVFINSALDELKNVFIIDQISPLNGNFDEHKVMLGFSSKEEAKEAYLSCYTKDWKGFTAITEISLEKFKLWMKDRTKIKFPASKTMFNSVNKVEEDFKLIRLEGDVIQDETLDNLKNQAGDLTGIKDLILAIASPGGSVSEGLSIMMWLDEVSKQGINVTTIVVANAYSIASLIMLAADRRLISNHGEVMVHNPMIPELKFVNSIELAKYYNELRDLEEFMYMLYGGLIGIDKSTIKKLMDKETFLSPQEAKELGFVDEIINMKEVPFVNSKAINLKRQNIMSKTLNMLNKVIAKLEQKEVVNQTYYALDGEKLEITQKDLNTYSEGDAVDKEDGKYQLADGSVITVEGGKISLIESVESSEGEEQAVEGAPLPGPAPIIEGDEEEVAAKDQEGDNPSTDVVSAEKEIADLEDKLKAKKEEVAKLNGEEEAKYDDQEGDNPSTPVSMDEYEEGAAPVATLEEAMAAIADLKDGYEMLKAGYEELKGRIEGLEGSSEVSKQELAEVKELQDISTQAIDVLADNAVTNFVPNQGKNDAPVSGTIFQRLRKASNK